MSLLRRGSRGSEVRRLQSALNAKLQPSPNLQVDGIFGRNTETAVRLYQANNGLTVDGVVGPQTWGSLSGAPATPPSEPLPVNRTSPPWMTVAQQEMHNGVANVAGSAANPRILQYHGTTTLQATSDETAWCSAFVNWCMLQAGQPGTNRANARSWLDWGRALDEPRYGCVTVLWRESPSSWKGHVAFYDGRSGSNVSLLGGNQSGRVRISNYEASRVLGYRWPS
ncbi:MAG: TIGR02594 family protein [Pirellulaceae bacterium]